MRLQNCCFCWRLRTGGIIIGVLGIIESLIVFASLSQAIMKTTQHISVTEIDNDYDNDYEFAPIQAQSTQIRMNAVHEGRLIVNCIIIVLSIFKLIASILLIVGSLKKRHRLLLPYLVIAAIDVITYLYGIFVIPLYFGISLFGIYVWACVYSLYREIVEEVP